jgi:hypothetical protein
MYSSQFFIQSGHHHTEKSHQTSTGPAAGGDGVRSEEAPSLGFFSNLADGAAGFYHSARNAVSGAAHTVGGVAATAYHGAASLANKASGYVQRAEHGVTRGLHAAEDWVDQGSHALAGRVVNVPVLGPVAQGLADQATMTTQLAGGVLGGATTLLGGIANAALHPIDTVAGVEAMVEHTPTPLGMMARGAHGLLDVARGRQTVGGMINRAVNPLATRQEDAEFWGQMGAALIEPYRQSIKEGRYGEAVGRGAFDVGSLLLGVGEVGEAARGVGVAGDVARAGDVADAARAAGTAGETSRALGVTSNATHVAETTGNTTRSAAATAEARAAGKLEQGTHVLSEAEKGEQGTKALREAYKGEQGASEAGTRKGAEEPKRSVDEPPHHLTPGEHYKKIATAEDAPRIYSDDPRFKELVKDPAHNGKVTSQSVKEAMTGLEAEKQGLVKGPIERGPQRIDFYGADGVPYDVKTPPSPPPGAPWPFKPKKPGDAILDQIREEFPNKATGAPEHVKVLLDTSYMTPADRASLWRYLEKNASKDELARIQELQVELPRLP